jgi:2,3-bisphosphoglycerate-dependent phosphoglycerate mutase
MHRLVLSFLFVLGISAQAFAQNTVFVVRHAERADTGALASPMMASDPDLSDAGKVRAESLATTLKDAGITAIFTTEYKRTQQTAAPLAKALGLQVTTVSARDMPGLIEKVKASNGNVLVVGHSNTVGDVVSRLGVTDAVKLGDNDYDNLFVVVRGEKPVLVRLHFK